MRSRVTSLMVLIGLLIGMVVMPTMVHAVSSGPVQGSEMLALEEAGETDNSHSQGAEKDLPSHASSHHHCGMALHLDDPHLNLTELAKRSLLHPTEAAPLVSRGQAPPLDPPLA